MANVSKLDVIHWEYDEVLMWALHCGFNEPDVLSNITQCKIGGRHLLNIPAAELGITDSNKIIKYDDDITELKLRHFQENINFLKRKKCSDIELAISMHKKKEQKKEKKKDYVRKKKLLKTDYGLLISDFYDGGKEFSRECHSPWDIIN